MIKRLLNAMRAHANAQIGSLKETISLPNLSEQATASRDRIAEMLAELKLSSPPWPGRPDVKALAANVKEQTSGAVKATDSWLQSLSTRLDALSSGLNDPKWQKDDVLRTIVHDLKHPLSVIKPCAETLRAQGDKLPPEQRAEFLDTISSSCDQLTMQIDDLLDTDPRRGIQLKLGQVDLAELARDTLKPFERDAKLRKESGATAHDFIVDFAADLKPIRADSREVKRVLSNLVSNAVKFSPTGGAVTVKAQNASHAVKVSVTDQGIGMTPEQQKQLYGLFTRVVDPKLGIKGTGVGLYSAKRLIEAHGGNLWVESAPGKGSTFFFTLLKRPGAG